METKVTASVEKKFSFFFLSFFTDVFYWCRLFNNRPRKPKSAPLVSCFFYPKKKKNFFSFSSRLHYLYLVCSPHGPSSVVMTSVLIKLPPPTFPWRFFFLLPRLMTVGVVESDAGMMKTLLLPCSPRRDTALSMTKERRRREKRFLSINKKKRKG